MAKARITLAQIQSPVHDRFRHGIGEALIPGLPIIRYGRTWRPEIARDQIDRLRDPDERVEYVTGRLGFDKTTGEAPAWDETSKEFRSRVQHDGDVVPFLLRLSDLTVSFQRTSKIKRQSFIGALQSLLREGSQDDGWKVADLLASIGWTEFKSQVAITQRVTVVVRPTNPGWAGQDLYEPYIEELGGDETKIVVKGNNLNLDSRPIEQARRHAIENGYGELSVEGETQDGSEIAFDSGDPVPLVDTYAERQSDGRVSTESLFEALHRIDEVRENGAAGGQEDPRSPS
jgi:hypothetical protein